jgi:hypothetical protein
MLLFWVLTPCGVQVDAVGFEEHTVSIFRHKQDEGSMFVRIIGTHLPTIPHGVPTQMKNIDIFTVVRTFNNMRFLQIKPIFKSHLCL